MFYFINMALLLLLYFYSYYPDNITKKYSGLLDIYIYILKNNHWAQRHNNTTQLNSIVVLKWAFNSIFNYSIFTSPNNVSEVWDEEQNTLTFETFQQVTPLLSYISPNQIFPKSIRTYAHALYIHLHPTTLNYPHIYTLKGIWSCSQ